MTSLDWLAIGAYFSVLLGLTWWSLLHSRETADDYFLAGRNLGWLVVGASIFASNIGSEHLVGLAGAGATTGVALAHYELHAWCLLVLGWVLVPFYLRSRVYTMPEFLERPLFTHRPLGAVAHLARGLCVDEDRGRDLRRRRRVRRAACRSCASRSGLSSSTASGSGRCSSCC
jgi:Na+(H+)/acetate symporter ActP